MNGRRGSGGGDLAETIALAAIESTMDKLLEQAIANGHADTLKKLERFLRSSSARVAAAIQRTSTPFKIKHRP